MATEVTGECKLWLQGGASWWACGLIVVSQLRGWV